MITRDARGVTADAGYDETHARVYPREYLDGIAHFNAGRYYDAHEIWEAVWLRSTGKTKLFYQMLIQTAVAFLHRERRNAHGARVLFGRVCTKLKRLPPVMMSLDVSDFARQFHGCFAQFGEETNEAEPATNQSLVIRLLPLD